MKLSIIIPAYNEEKYIENCISSVLAQKHDYSTEIFIIDGASVDKTKEIASTFKEVTVLDNPNRTKPYALNIGIKRAQGNYVMIIDAHSVYPDGYIQTIVSFLENNPQFSNAGCPFNTRPGNDSAKAKAISYALSSSFGIGNSEHRVGVNEVVDTDTVPFGCYRKEVFAKVGLFDLDLTRNQDDEFNARLVKNGLKIALLPNPKINYFARTTIYKVSQMVYQYGLFKPLVGKKIGKPTSLRQLVPPVFVVSLLVSILIIPKTSILLGIVIIPYMLFLALGAAICFKNTKSIMIPVYFVATVFVMHLSYGVGYIQGLSKLFGSEKIDVSSSR